MRVCVSVPFQIFFLYEAGDLKGWPLDEKGFCLNAIAVMTVIVTIVIVGLFLFMRHCRNVASVYILFMSYGFLL